MSFHLVHILKHASSLTVDRGCLVCKVPDEPQKRIPKKDVLALIVAARGVSFSGSAMSELLKSNAVILHCDENYRPIGKTVGLSQVVHSNIFTKQIEADIYFNDKIWQTLLLAKTQNQAVLLDKISKEHKLWDYLKSGFIDEGNCARHYWKHYFKNFGRKKPKTREYKGAENPVNQFLNYSYAVLGAIIHRSIVIHGLNPCLGVHHRYRFKADPLLYDLIEPLRPLCDFLLLRFHLKNKKRKLADWVKHVAGELINFRLKVSHNKSLKLLYSVDKYIKSIADVFNTQNIKNIFIPKLADLYFDERN